MFRKILLNYFPEIKNTGLSPIHFHLRLLSPKLFYGISSKYGVENRRIVKLDMNFSYFFPIKKKLLSSNEENFLYSYKNFASLNGFDNYNLYVIISALLILVLKTYYKYFTEENIAYFINPLLHSFNYLFIFFYTRFKQYEEDNDNLNLEFMINLLEQIIINLEKNNKNQNKIVLKLIGIIKKEPEFLMFSYKTSKFLQTIHEGKPYTDIVFYEYLVSSSINIISKDNSFLLNLNKSLKQIFLKRYTYYVSDDMIILSNMILGDRGYIGYLTDPRNFDFIPYFVDSLSHLDKIDLNRSLFEIIDKILDFDEWGKKYILALRDFNSDYIDINIQPDMKPEQVQELISKETIDAVKRVSIINEQFLDYYILLISRKLNNNGDNLQAELLNNTSTLLLKKNNRFIYDKKLYENLRKKYILLDKNYFLQSLVLKLKRSVPDIVLLYNFLDKVLNYEISLSAKKNILLDFSKKTHKEYIENINYIHILKNSFKKDINYFISSKDLKKDYLQKYYPGCFDDYDLTVQQIKNFKENVYYPDFITYFKFLKFMRKKFKEEDLLLAARFKETLFGYIIFQYIIGYNENLGNIYLLGLNIYEKNIKINLKKFYDYFIKNYSEFIEIFSNVNQNKRFVDINLNLIDKIPEKEVFVYDMLRDITYYNKRMFKI